MLQEDEKYKALRDQLRTLPRVKAKQDFEDRLLRRIKDAENPARLSGTVTQPVYKHQPAKKSWLESLFRPSFVPALGLSVVLLVAVVVYFAYYSKLNDGLTENTQHFVSSTNQGDLIIYVKKDADDISGNYPKEYSAVEPTETGNTEFAPAPPSETSTDYFAKPDAPRSVTPELKPDRVSEEQKIEMQRSFDKDLDKGVDTKGERKLDGIMKKESKIEIKTESKGMEKKETSEPKKKVSDEKKNILIDEESDDVVKQKVNEEGQKNKTEDNLGRISRATKKDSTKDKSESEADDKNTIEQK